MGLAVVRDLREMRSPAGAEEIAGFETDVLAGFVLARKLAGPGQLPGFIPAAGVVGQDVPCAARW